MQCMILCSCVSASNIWEILWRCACWGCSSAPIDMAEKLRAAMESDYVSENLHHWLDMCFGVQQEANNVHCKSTSHFSLLFLPKSGGLFHSSCGSCLLWRLLVSCEEQTPTLFTRVPQHLLSNARRAFWRSLLVVSRLFRSSTRLTPSVRLRHRLHPRYEKAIVQCSVVNPSEGVRE